MVRIRSPYFRERMPQICGGESLTEQGHAESVDVNNIVRRFHRTGVLPPAAHPPVYADVTRLQAPLQERIAFAASTISAVDDFLATVDSPVASVPLSESDKSDSVPGSQA